MILPLNHQELLSGNDTFNVCHCFIEVSGLTNEQKAVLEAKHLNN